MPTENNIWRFALSTGWFAVFYLILINSATAELEEPNVAFGPPSEMLLFAVFALMGLFLGILFGLLGLLLAGWRTLLFLLTCFTVFFVIGGGCWLVTVNLPLGRDIRVLVGTALAYLVTVGLAWRCRGFGEWLGK